MHEFHELVTRCYTQASPFTYLPCPRRGIGTTTTRNCQAETVPLLVAMNITVAHYHRELNGTVLTENRWYVVDFIIDVHCTCLMTRLNAGCNFPVLQITFLKVIKHHISSSSCPSYRCTKSTVSKTLKTSQSYYLILLIILRLFH